MQVPVVPWVSCERGVLDRAGWMHDLPAQLSDRLAGRHHEAVQPGIECGSVDGRRPMSWWPAC